MRIEWNFTGRQSVTEKSIREGVSSAYVRMIDSAKTFVLALIGCFL